MSHIVLVNDSVNTDNVKFGEFKWSYGLDSDGGPVSVEAPSFPAEDGRCRLCLMI